MLEIEKNELYEISEIEFSWRYATGETLFVHTVNNYRERGEIFYLYVTKWRQDPELRSKMEILLENGYDVGSGQEFYLGKNIFCSMIEEGEKDVVEWLIPYYKKSKNKKENPYFEAARFFRKDMEIIEIKEKKMEMIHILLKNGIDLEKIIEKNEQEQDIFDMMKEEGVQEYVALFDTYLLKFPTSIQDIYKQIRLKALF